MKTFSSPASVIALWLAVSFVLWLGYIVIRRRDGSRQRKLVENALALIGGSQKLFDEWRTLSSGKATRKLPSRHEEDTREEVRGLLNRIEADSAFFDQVNAAKKKIQTKFDLADFLPLSEILQIRRDFWAASEIFLMDDIRSLSPELADNTAYEAFRLEAGALLFKDAFVSGGGEIHLEYHDPVELRLSAAREQATAFLAEVDRLIAAEREKNRFPRPAEIVAGPWRLLMAAVSVVREARYIVSEIAANAQSIARGMRLRGIKGAADHLRRNRHDLPGQFATAFERAGGLARKGGQGLRRHYEFLLEARELRARYAEFLARAPGLTDKGRQFLARLELEKRAEQFRQGSQGASDWARQKIAVGIAYLIGGLQYVQAKITPREHKQLVLRPAENTVPDEAEVAARNTGAEPLRVLLLPASSYEGGNRGRGYGEEPRFARNKGAANSLLDRLAAANYQDTLVSEEETAAASKKPNGAKPSKSRMFGSKRA
jgi:hypothetical protein